MFQRSARVFFLVTAIVSFNQTVFAGKVELTTYYPAPFGEYQELNSTGNSHFATNAGANVGIGTTTPVAKLDVVGNVTVSQGANFATTAGNVGIGTTAPATKLDVVGDIRNTTGASLATNSGQVTVGSPAALVVQNGRNLSLNANENMVADDVYMRSPRNGVARWASESSSGAAAIFGPVCIGQGLCPAGTPSSLTINGRSFCALSYVRTWANASALWDDVRCQVTPTATPGQWTLSAAKNAVNAFTGVTCNAACS
jgi:hypothetical protein